MKRIFLLMMLLSQLSVAQINETSKDEFVSRFARLHGWTTEEVNDLLSRAVYQPKIIEKMERPAEGMPWYRYRRIFMKEERYEAGRAFYNTHKEVLESVSDETGVSVNAMMGILGVETYYGTRKGSYKVLDALYTLAFGYPKRARFFTRELEEFLLLTREEQLDVDEVEGSYAGAIGYCQFMPSSYRAYAKSYDKGGTRDLVNSPEDAIASVANYLKVHRWKKGEKVASSIIASPDAASPGSTRVRPKNSLSQYEDLGFMPTEDLDPTTLVAFLEFEQESGKEFWYGLHNFYVITRYNHSPLYALAVYQLGEEVMKGM